MLVAGRESPPISTTGIVVFCAALAVVIAGLIVAERSGAEALAIANGKRAGEIAAESKAFCEKHTSGADRAANCVTDLQVIRENHGRRVMADAEGIL